MEEDTLIQAKEVNLNKFGKIDTLINGAGGNHEDTITSVETQHLDGNAEKSFFDMTDEGFTNVFEKTLRGSFLAAVVFGESLFDQTESAFQNL
ncbi:hypothetical protein [Oceanobacillus picturae]|uniref:hypothetical protein n=1 Tax=Oceanobacillus picturae TaxID=171693 RepID=UPI003641D513